MNTAITRHHPPILGVRRSGLLAALLGSILPVTTAFAQLSYSANNTLDPIIVDGALNESVWSTTAAVSETVLGTPNNTVTFGALWTNTYLYVSIRVLDSQLFNDTPNSGTPIDVWVDDSVEVFIDANHNHATTYELTGGASGLGYDRQFSKGYNDSALGGKGSQTGVVYAWAPISGGYTIEIAIPWTNVNVTGVAGLQIGFDVAVNDDDDGGATRESYVVWTGTSANSANTSAFGHLTLSATTVGGGVPEINVQGGSPLVSIPDGDVSPSLEDHTDFGSADVTSGTVSRTFTIRNTGTGTLTVGTVGSPGTDFSVTAQPAASVAPGASTTFSVLFIPSSAVQRTGTVSFTNNDTSESTYNFSIQGLGTSASAQQFINLWMFAIAQDGGQGNLLLNTSVSDIARWDGGTYFAGMAFKYGGSDTTSNPGSRPTLWRALSNAKPGFYSVLYKKGFPINSNHLALAPYNRSTIGRVFSASGAEPQGAADNSPVNASNKNLRLMGASGAQCYNATWQPAGTGGYSLFGDVDYQNFWLQAIRNDVKTYSSGQFSDGARAIHTDESKVFYGSGGGISETPALTTYRNVNPNGWTDRAISFYKFAAKQLPLQLGLDYQCSSDPGSSFPAPGIAPLWIGANSWAAADRPKQILAEAMFFSQPWFRDGQIWVERINALRDVTGYEPVAFQEDSDASFTDGNGNPATNEDALFYSLASFLLVKKDSPKFWFGFGRVRDQDGDTWYREFQSLRNGHLNLGGYVDTVYQTSSASGVTVYYRKYQNGLVVVNPNGSNTTVTLSNLDVGPMRKITRANLLTPLGSIGTTTWVQIKARRAAILRY